MSVSPYYEREGVRLYHADCRGVLPTLDKASIDLVLTDPPYGIAFVSHGQLFKGNGGIRGDGNDECARLACEWGHPAVARAVFATPNWQPPIKPQQELIWDKGPALGIGGDRSVWKRCHERIVTWKCRNRGNRDSSVLQFWHNPKSCYSSGHPCEKPIDLLGYLIEKLSDCGATILDPFMGSGSTGEACIRLGRKFVGIELEERWCEHAAKRLDRILDEPRLPFVEEKPDRQLECFGD